MCTSLTKAWQQDGRALTIIPLSNPILDSSPLSEIRYLCPVFIGVRTGTEGTAGAVCGRILGRSRAGEGIRVAIVTLHGSDGGSLAWWNIWWGRAWTLMVLGVTILLSTEQKDAQLKGVKWIRDYGARTDILISKSPWYGRRLRRAVLTELLRMPSRCSCSNPTSWCAHGLPSRLHTSLRALINILIMPCSLGSWGPWDEDRFCRRRSTRPRT